MFHGRIACFGSTNGECQPAFPRVLERSVMILSCLVDVKKHEAECWQGTITITRTLILLRLHSARSEVFHRRTRLPDQLLLRSVVSHPCCPHHHRVVVKKPHTAPIRRLARGGIDKPLAIRANPLPCIRAIRRCAITRTGNDVSSARTRNRWCAMSSREER